MSFVFSSKNKSIALVLKLVCTLGLFAACQQQDASPRASVKAVKSGLALTANDRTGAVEAVLENLGDVEGLSDGSEVLLRWGVESNHLHASVDCSKLPNTEVVRLPKKGEKKSVQKQVGSQLTRNFQPDPEGKRKASVAWFNSDKGPKRVVGCVVAKENPNKVIYRAKARPAPIEISMTDPRGAYALTEAEQQELANWNINEYGKQCAEKLGPIPAFSCLDDSIGQDIPITVDGQAPTQYTSNMRCDKPIYLGLGSDGQCVPYARILKLTSTKPGVETVAICRRYKLRTDKSDQNFPLFEDVAIVQHNTQTGDTCWFQALAGSTGKSFPTTRVPPPTEAELPNEVVSASANMPEQLKPWAAKDFWLSPKSISNIKCVTCHDSDPFMHSPYIDQVKNPASPDETLVPSYTDGPYNIIGKFYFASGKGHEAWPTSFAVNTESGNKCASCHRIGSLNTCKTWARDAVGHTTFTDGLKTDVAKTFPLSHWMPPRKDINNWPNLEGGLQVTAAQWDQKYKEHAKQILECCDNPTAAGCVREKITGAAAP